MIVNPYKGLEHTARLQTRVSKDDHSFLTHLNPEPNKAFIEPIINTLFHKLILACKANNILTYTDYGKLTALVNSVSFTTDLQPASGTPIIITHGQRPLPDDGGGDKTTNNPMECTTSVNNDPKKRTPKRSGRSGPRVKRTSKEGESGTQTAS